MRLYSKKWELSIELSDIRPTTIVVENPKVLSDLCNDIWMQSIGLEGDIVLSSEGKAIRLQKSAAVIFNPFSISCNDKKIISKLYKEMNETAVESYYHDTCELLSKIVGYIEMIGMKMPYPISYNTELNSEGLYKLFEVSIDDDSTNLLEKLINYIKLMNRVAGIRVIMMLGLKSYLSSEEIELLYKEILYEKVIFFNIESNQDCKIKDEHVIIFDKGLCQIDLN